MSIVRMRDWKMTTVSGGKVKKIQQQGRVKGSYRVSSFQNKVRSSFKGLAVLSTGQGSWEFPNL